jgi:DNA polymerase I
MGVLDDVRLHLVDDMATAMELKRWLGERRETPIGLDTETGGLNPHTCSLRLVQVGDLHQGWAIPFPMWGGLVQEILREYTGPWVMHNRPFDTRFLHVHTGWNIPWHRIDDTMTMMPLVNPVESKALKPFSARHIDPSATLGQDLLDEGMAKYGWTWATVPYDFPPYWLYSALDPVLTVHNHQYLKPQVEASYAEPYDLEMGVNRIYTEMMLVGMKIDVPYIEAELTRLTQFTTQAREWMLTAHGLTSPMAGDQIVDIMANRYGHTFTKFTKGGKPSADKDQLTLIKNWSPYTDARQLAEYILAARHAEKLTGSYLSNFLEMRDADDVIHATINAMAARTGRSSVSDPSLQNLPRDDKVVRGSYVPRPGNALLTVDLDQIEARITAHFSADPGLIAAFLDAEANGTDFFCEIASQIFREPIDKSDPRRSRTKNVTYGKIYNSGLDTMAETAGVPVAQMRPVRDAFERLYPGIKALNDMIIREARASAVPCVYTPTGRRLVADADRYYTQLLNAKVQGTAAEYLKRCVIELDSAGLGEYLRLTVHDEVIAEAPVDIADDVCREISEIMSNRTDYLVPITAAGKVMPVRWAK